MKLKMKWMKSKNGKKKIKQKDLKNKTNKCTYDFQQVERIRSFGDNNYTGKTNIDEAGMDQSNLLENIVNLNNKSRPRLNKDKEKKILMSTYESAYALYEGQELTYNTFESGIFPIKETQGKELKILTPKEMFQRLQIALAQVKAHSTSENLLNEIRHVMYSLNSEKGITKKVYNNIIKGII